MRKWCRRSISMAAYIGNTHTAHCASSTKMSSRITASLVPIKQSFAVVVGLQIEKRLKSD